jgi:hypothetical protein
MASKNMMNNYRGQSAQEVNLLLHKDYASAEPQPGSAHFFRRT